MSEDDPTILRFPSDFDDERNGDSSDSGENGALSEGGQATLSGMLEELREQVAESQSMPHALREEIDRELGVLLQSATSVPSSLAQSSVWVLIGEAILHMSNEPAEAQALLDAMGQVIGLIGEHDDPDEPQSGGHWFRIAEEDSH